MFLFPFHLKNAVKAVGALPLVSAKVNSSTLLAFSLTQSKYNHTMPTKKPATPKKAAKREKPLLIKGKFIDVIKAAVKPKKKASK